MGAPPNVGITRMRSKFDKFSMSTYVRTSTGAKMATRSMRKARLRMEPCDRPLKKPKPASTPPPPTVSVLDVTSGQAVTVALGEGGLETVEALVLGVQQELRKATRNDQLLVRRMACGTSVVWRNGSAWRRRTDAKTLDYYLLDGEGWTVLTFTPHPQSPDDFTIFVDTLSGSRHTLNRINKSTSVLEIKRSLEECEGTPIEQQRLIFGSKQLDDWSTLGESNVSNGAALNMVMRLSGGGCAPGSQFIDISNPSGPTRKKWSEDAPQWRIASPGLCLEGVCKNKKCRAYKHHVIMNKHFAQFDLIEDAHSCTCPMCASPVVPTTCAFTNCRWKWVGKKIDPRTRLPVVLRSNGWNTADDAYHRFDEDTSGTVNWLHLKITTEPIKATRRETTCILCLREHVAESKCMALDCGHTFHPSCVDHWHTENSTCPLCRAQSHMTPFQKREAGL